MITRLDDLFMDAPTNNPPGWSGTIQTFLGTSRQDWLNALLDYHTVCRNCPANDSQRDAWEQSFEILQKELKQLVQLIPDLGKYTIIFEYELQCKNDRCLGVIILGASVYILEFKDSDEIIRAHIDQVNGCAGDLEKYHTASRQKDVIRVLVLTKMKNSIKRDEDVVILSPDHIADFFIVHAELETGSLIDPVCWIAAE